MAVGDTKAVVPGANLQTDALPSTRGEQRLVDIIDRLYEGKEVFFQYVRTVADVMTTDVKTLTLDNKVADGLAFLTEHRVRHIPIVEMVEEEMPEKGETKPTKRVLIGIVTQRDLVRLISPGVGTLIQTDRDEKTMMKPLGTVVTRNPRTAMPSTPLFDAVQLMMEEKFDCLPVVMGSDKELVGLLTSTDIIKCFLRMEVLRKARKAKPLAPRLIDFIRKQDMNQPTELLMEAMMGRVADIMQEAVVWVTVEDTLGKAVNLMQEHSFRHLPVVDGQGGISGILSDRDILRYLPAPASEQRGRRRQNGNPQPKFREDLFQIDPNDKATAKVLCEKITVAMTENPVTVDPTTPLAKVAELFCSHQLGAVPVVATNESGIIGIVTQTDILAAILTLGRLLARGMGADHSFPADAPNQP